MGSELDMFLQEFENLMGMGLVPMLLSEIPSMLLNVAIYIFTGLGLYTIAKRRGIHNPWLAWVPFANAWLLGCISDQYRSIARGEVKNRRKVLLGTEIAASAIAIVVLVLCFSMLFNMLSIGMSNLESLNEDAAMELLMTIMGPVVTMLLLCLPLMIVGIVNMVFYYIALHDIYKSCDPNNATLYLVLNIFIGITVPVFLMICRNKDDGMPLPQVEQPVYEVPQWQPVEQPAEVPAEPSVEDPVEPWQQNEE